MNLKEAFRFQNKLLSLMGQAHEILGNEAYITKVEKTYLRHKVMPEAEDETVEEVACPEYQDRITDLAEFLMFLLDQRELLSAAIHKAKQSLDLPAGLDGEVSLNSKRQEAAALFRSMAALRSSEVITRDGGVGYRFNNEGNQVAYRCDAKTVTTINFDRNKIRRFCTALSKQADETSTRLDEVMLRTQVSYQPPFDVNETFSDALDLFTQQRV